MRIFYSKNQKENNPWQTYLDKTAKKQSSHQEAVFTQNFWKNYEAMVDASRKLRRSPSKVYSKILSIDLPTIFKNYWSNAGSILKYKSPETDENTNWSGTIALFLFLASGIFFFLGFYVQANKHNYQMPASVFFISSFLSIVVFNILLQAERDAGSGPNSEYIIEFHPEYIFFTRLNSSGNRQVCYVYYKQIKALDIDDKQLKLKALYNKSFFDKVANREIIRKFTIPRKAPDYQKVETFLREVVNYNQQMAIERSAA